MGGGGGDERGVSRVVKRYEIWMMSMLDTLRL